MKKKMLTFGLMCIIMMGYAQPNYLSPNERMAYLENEDVISKRVEIAVSDRMMSMKSRYKVQEEFANDLQLLIEMEECKKICNEYLYPDNPIERYRAKRQVEAEYEDLVFRILFLSGNDISSPNLHIAARTRKALELTAAQEDELVQEAITNKKRLDEIPRRDLWREELGALQRILDDKQFDKFFLIKHSDRTWRDAKVHWTRLKGNGMTHDLDSAQAIGQIYTHLLKKKKAEDIHAFDSKKKLEAISEIDRNAPLPMRRSYSVDIKNAVRKKGYRGSFTW